MSQGFGRTARRVTVCITTAILMAWLWVHGGSLAQMAHRIVLDLHPLTTGVKVPVAAGFREQRLLPQAAINFRPELMQVPVCVTLDLFAAEGASGRLILKVITGSALLAEGGIRARQIVDGENRICLDLTLEQLSTTAVALEVAGDPQEPMRGVDLMMGTPLKAAGEKPALVLRLIAQAPWKLRQLVSTLMVWALVMGLLVWVLRSLWGDSQPVK